MVIDASVAVAYLSMGPDRAVARRRLLDEPGDLVAPHLIDAEVGHALRRGAASGAISPEIADAAIATLVVLPISRFPHVGLMRRAWELRNSVSFHDGLYVALAELLDLPLLTLDLRLARAPGVRARIEALS